MRDPPEVIHYEAASTTDREKLIEGAQLRISLLLGSVAQSPLRTCNFRLDVVSNWLHMIFFNDKLPPPEWLRETFSEMCTGPGSEPIPEEAIRYHCALWRLSRTLLERAAEKQATMAEGREGSSMGSAV
jgi:hypothetical protein